MPNSPLSSNDSLAGRNPKEKEAEDKPDINVTPLLDHAKACKEVGKQELMAELEEKNKSKLTDMLKSSQFKLPEKIVQLVRNGFDSPIFEQNHYNLDLVLDKLIKNLKDSSPTDVDALWKNAFTVEESREANIKVIKTLLISEIRRSEAMSRIKVFKEKVDNMQSDYNSCEGYIDELEANNNKYARIILIMGKTWNTLYRLFIDRATYTEFKEQIEVLSAYDNELVEEIPDLIDDESINLPLACLSSQLTSNKALDLINRHNQLVEAYKTSNNHVWGLVLLFTLYSMPSNDLWHILGVMICAHISLYIYNRIFFNDVITIAREIQ